MIILPVLAALTLYVEPPEAPSRLDPDDIDALIALMESLSPSPAPEPGEAEPEGASEADAPATEPTGDDAADPADETGEAAAIDEAADDSAATPADDATEDDALEGEALEEEAVEDEAVTGPAAEDAADEAGVEDAGATDSAAPSDDTASDEAAVTDEPARAEPAVTPAAESAPAARPAPASRVMGPHTGPRDYETVRGSRLGSVTGFAWSVSVRPLGDEGATLAAEANGSASERRFLAGNGWAADNSGSTLNLYDFAARRLLRVNRDARTVTNTSLYAAARRNFDIYMFLSDAGQRERIEFGPGTVFDRFWLEAAMGVAAEPARLNTQETPRSDGGRDVSWQREGEEMTVAIARYGECAAVNTATTRHLLAGLGHALALHPQIIEAMDQRGEVPCAFSFVIISPDSPRGRVETWTLESAGPATLRLADFAGFRLTMPEASLLDGETIEAALAAVSGERGAAPPAPEFLGDIQALRNAGDYAGALLMLVQETAHFGPCPAETVGSERLACAGAVSLAQAGAGNAAFERVMEATAAVQENAHRVVIENLSGFLDRSDPPGAAARTLVANEMVSWGSEALSVYPDIDPGVLLQEALIMDPFAPDAYWHLGRRYMEAGAPEAAWTLFDLGRALPGREATPLLQQATRIERSLEQLAPALFGPAAQ
ncbi:MAG: hypothetical protein ACK4NO_06655 [Glycocaulis sp.]